MRHLKQGEAACAIQPRHGVPAGRDGECGHLGITRNRAEAFSRLKANYFAIQADQPPMALLIANIAGGIPFHLGPLVPPGVVQGARMEIAKTKHPIGPAGENAQTVALHPQKGAIRREWTMIVETTPHP